MLSVKKVLLSSVAIALMFSAPSLAGQSTTAAAQKEKKKAPVTAVNLNTASEADLEAIPGVGAPTAKKIIAGRPYAAVSDLARAGVSKATIDKISSMVTTGLATSGSAAAAPVPAAPKPVSRANTAPSVAGAAAQQPPMKGMVWVNLSTKVFHREGDRYYGNTKNGKFMTEADAVKAGYREAKTKADKASK
ncbi:MAG: helix-hairpin-helix domain-containing protein [Acidobacteriota bacterium]